MAISIGAVWGKVWPFLVAILYFGFLILSHELGHFGTARAFRVRVTEFSLGMGPKLLKFKRGETTYCLKAIPFGGSCMMDEDVENSDDPRGFVNQKAWKRALILVNGAVMNLLCGLVIMTIMVGTRGLVHTMKINYFAEGATSQASGLQAGDEFRKINGRRVYSSLDINFLLSRDSDGVVDLVMRRDGKDMAFQGVAFPSETADNGQKITYQDFVGLGIARDKNDPDSVSAPKYAAMVLGDSARECVSVVRIVWLSVLDLVTGKYHFADLSGPVGVVQIISDQASEAQASAEANDSEALHDAVQMLLFLFALISMNIGLMNLLPIPALDGGRIFFCLAEMIFRKPIPKKFEAVVHAVGIVLLFGFMIVVSITDIIAWVKGTR